MAITASTFHLDTMTHDDIAEVSRVERRCFSHPWPAAAYRRELRNHTQNYYVVLRAKLGEASAESDEGIEHSAQRFEVGGRARSRFQLLPFPRRPAAAASAPRIAGFAGMWTIFDEAHITTIGVDPHYRGRGFGELLFLALLDEAIRRGASFVTLEVRVSNTIAQDLYQKYGLAIRGRKRGYYSDDGEDAFIMWSRSLRDHRYLTQIDELRDQLATRLGPTVAVPPAQTSPWQESSTVNLVSLEDGLR